MKPHIQKSNAVDLSQHEMKKRFTTTISQIMELHEEAFKNQLWQQIAPLFEHVDGYGQVIQKETLRRAIFNEKGAA